MAAVAVAAAAAAVEPREAGERAARPAAPAPKVRRATNPACARPLAARGSGHRRRHVSGWRLRLLDAGLSPTWTNAMFRRWAPEESASLAVAARTLSDGATRSSEHQIKEADNRSRFFALTTAAMAGDDSQPRHVVQLVQDITSRKEAEAEAIHVGKLAAVGELAGNLAHEINNPLGILSARIHLLLKDRDRPAELVTEDLRKLSSQVDRISGITRSLLGHVRPSARERDPLRIEQVFEHAVVLMETLASRKNIRITWHAAEDSPLIVASAGELEQVLVNLLMNAVDASPSGGTVEVSAAGVTLDSGEEALQIAVEDAGPGLPDALRPRVFEPFFSTKKTGEGTGLGLSLSQRIVKDHGGEIRVEQGRVGARFLVVIPSRFSGEA